MSLLNYKIPRDVEPGVYDTNIRYYKEFNPKDRQPYILVEMLIDGLIITDRWYASRIPYLMYCLRTQFHKEYLDCTLSQLLEIAKYRKLRVIVSYDPRYGRQIDYKID